MCVLLMLYVRTQLAAITAHVQWGTLEMEVVVVSTHTSQLTCVFKSMFSSMCTNTLQYSLLYQV